MSRTELEKEFTARALAISNYDGQGWTAEHIEEMLPMFDACSAYISWFYKKALGKNVSFHWGCILHDFLYSVGGPLEVKMAADVLLHDYAEAVGKDKGRIKKLFYSLRAKAVFAGVEKCGNIYFNWRV